MSRAKKTDNTAAAAGGSSSQKSPGTITIDLDSFVRTRDSTFYDQITLINVKVVTGLATLQDAIQTLSTAYIKHTNAVLGEHGGTYDVAAAMAKLGENPLLRLGGDLRGPSEPTHVPEPAGDGKKERKKRAHDPDAPKRPLTPFFLYMQTARPIIAGDLGPDVPKGAVSNEGTQRWGTMAPEDKQLWTNAYKENLRLYNARMHFYRRGYKEAKDMSDQDASAYADEYNIGTDAGADAQITGEAAANQGDQDAEGEPEKEPTPPPAVKTPKSAPKRKSKSAKAAEEATSDPVPAPTPSIVPPKAAEKETPKSPDKKRKRASKKASAEEPAVSPEKPEEPAETPAKSASKPRKKKAKSDA